MTGSDGDAGATSRPPRRNRAATWRCPDPSEFSLLVVTQHLDIVVQMCGELDVTALSSLEECLTVAVGEEPRRLVLDLSALDFIDAAGLGALVRARHLAETRDVAFVLDSPTPSVTRVLALTDLEGQFAIR